MTTASPVTWGMPSTSGSGPTYLRHFSFVQQSENVNASKTRRAVRSHAMRAVRRQQRHDSARPTRLRWPRESSSSKSRQITKPDKKLADSAEQLKTPRLEEQIQPLSKEGDANSDDPSWDLSNLFSGLNEHVSLQTEFQESRVAPSEGLSSMYSSEGQDLQPYTATEVDKEIMPTFTHPRTLLGAGRLDPFQTSPIHINRRLAELIDHYTTIMPATFYGIRCRKPIHIDLYRCAISHPGSIHAIAAYASKSLDFLRFSEASQLTLDHTMRAVQCVNEGLLATDTYQTERDDDVILSIALLAFAELRFGRKDIARQHWIGLREIVRYRGGFSAVRCNHQLKAVLSWNSTVWSPSRSSSVSGSPDLPSFVEPDTFTELRLASQQFINFFHRLNDNAYSHSVYIDPNDSTHTACPYKVSQTAQKQSLFAPGTPLCRLLNSHYDSSMGLAKQRAFDACQLPCLLYINAVMLEYASGPYLIDDFFAKLISVVYEDNLDNCVSPEHLLIRLLVGIEGTEARRDVRLCEVTKLIYVAKRLGKSSMEMARNALWRNLVLSDGPCRKERLFMWDPVMLEAEILRE